MNLHRENPKNSHQKLRRIIDFSKVAGPKNQHKKIIYIVKNMKEKSRKQSHFKYYKKI
jgi:hypothetical protein